MNIVLVGGKCDGNIVDADIRRDVVEVFALDDPCLAAIFDLNAISDTRQATFTRDHYYIEEILGTHPRLYFGRHHSINKHQALSKLLSGYSPNAEHTPKK